MDIEKILLLPELQPIRERAKEWLEVLNRDIDFWHKESIMHTKEHVSRVLIYALLIGHHLELAEADLNILSTAAIFHDTRRKNDGLDVGHGKRAAEYYRSHVQVLGLDFNPTCYDIIYFHDRNDKKGIKALSHNPQAQSNGVLLYQAFKDADALDRFRLSLFGLDVRYLRTPPALELVPLAERIWLDYCKDF
ncbi:MAG: HD domain-containing protein [Fastidiosipilaceae bacterium]|jgi:hypothetical protein|nr:HD domain-containing protein [Clostridiaceae bacterium]